MLNFSFEQCVTRPRISFQPVGGHIQVVQKRTRIRTSALAFSSSNPPPLRFHAAVALHSGPSATKTDARMDGCSCVLCTAVGMLGVLPEGGLPVSQQALVHEGDHSGQRGRRGRRAAHLLDLAIHHHHQVVSRRRDIWETPA